MRLVIAILLTAAAAMAQEQKGLTAEQAKELLPRANLAELTDQQRAVFAEAAGDLYGYAGCTETLAKCLAKGQKDPHALRMAELVKHLAAEGISETLLVQAVEKYYDSFAPKKRLRVRSDNCPVLGTGPIAIVEFSDYQCPHCAAALEPLHELVTKDRKGKLRLCSKYFPFPAHPRARIAALCAEYARAHGKFWQMNKLLFANQDALEDDNLKSYAKQLGLNGAEMLKKIHSGAYDQAVEKHIREGTAAGVESTPTLFIDGRVSVLPTKPLYLQFEVDDEIAWRKDRVWNPPPRAPKKVAKRK